MQRAAQAHRQGGNKKRALVLYQNYLHVFGDRATNREEVQKLILNLKKAIAEDEQMANAPPVAQQPLSTPEAKPEPKPEPTVTAPAVAITAPPPPERKPLIKRAWFWGVIGGAAAIVATSVALGVVYGGHDVGPSSNFGIVRGN